MTRTPGAKNDPEIRLRLLYDCLRDNTPENRPRIHLQQLHAFLSIGMGVMTDGKVRFYTRAMQSRGYVVREGELFRVLSEPAPPVFVPPGPTGRPPLRKRTPSRNSLPEPITEAIGALGEPTDSGDEFLNPTVHRVP